MPENIVLTSEHIDEDFKKQLDSIGDAPVTFRHFAEVLDGVKAHLRSPAFLEAVETRLAQRSAAADGQAERELIGIISGLERRIAQLEMAAAKAAR